VTTISNGILQIPAIANGSSPSPLGASTNDAGNLVINGGTLKYTGNGSTDRLFSIGTSGATIDGSGIGALQFKIGRASCREGDWSSDVCSSDLLPRSPTASSRFPRSPTAAPRARSAPRRMTPAIW